MILKYFSKIRSIEKKAKLETMRRHTVLVEKIGPILCTVS